MGKYRFKKKMNWRWWVTPKLLEGKPIHRWCVFPHSYTSELVHALIEEWDLGSEDLILDPFAGAGTTLLAAKEKDVPATGYDLSPMAVLASRAKVANYNLSRLSSAWGQLRDDIDSAQWNGVLREYPQLVRKALPGKLLSGFDDILDSIRGLDASRNEKAFLTLAVLSLVPRYSRAVATGGWLSWVEKRERSTSLAGALAKRMEEMIADFKAAELPCRAKWRAAIADARSLPDVDNTFSAVITSPPYPNRHDYTRVFGVELMLVFLDWNKTRNLRYQSFHSHPEARPKRPPHDEYTEPRALTRAMKRIRAAKKDERVPVMVEGYFLDMYLCLREAHRVCRPGARLAYVVGNAQYCGRCVPVDELTAELGEQAGLTCEKIIAVRYRGNSAQQMGAFGRNPSRESVIIFREPAAG